MNYEPTTVILANAIADFFPDPESYRMRAGKTNVSSVSVLLVMLTN